MSNDPFSDVDDETVVQRGVLDSKALRNHERVVDKVNAQGHGWDFTCNCQHCNRQATVTLTWPELIVASVGVLPLDPDSGRAWVTQNGFMYPPVACGACGNMLSIGLTPVRAAKLLQLGINAGKVDPAFVVKGQTETRQRAGHVRR